MNKAKSGPPQRGGAAGNKPSGRDYDKPWLQPKKESNEPKTFLEHHYPDGAGPDVDLIQMMEREVIDKSPNVHFDDIADLDDTKKLL